MHTYTNKKDVFDLLDDYSGRRKSEIDRHDLSRGLITSYLLESHGHNSNGKLDVPGVLAGREWDLRQIEDDFFVVLDREQTVGFAEPLSKRHLILHSTLATQEADRIVQSRVRNSSHLDSAWFAGNYLQSLWKNIVLKTVPNRVTKIKFEHQSTFEISDFASEFGLFREMTEDEEEEGERYLNDFEVSEQPSSGSEIKERSSEINRILPTLQEIYPPFRAIKMLRIPAHSAPGGYDIWSWGKMTLRSYSFRQGRSLLQVVANLYEQVTLSIEDRLWLSTERTQVRNGKEVLKINGAVFTMQFYPELSLRTFQNLIETTFIKGQGPLKLWGNPIPKGEGKVHVYGIDMHLWQQIYMEISTKHMTVILPKGTCGNTVHRLIANIQRYVSPGVKAFIGASTYEKVIDDVFAENEH